MTINSSANSVILILCAFSDNLSAENSKSSADYSIQLIQLLECMSMEGHQCLKNTRFFFFGMLYNLKIHVLMQRSAKICSVKYAYIE